MVEELKDKQLGKCKFCDGNVRIMSSTYHQTTDLINLLFFPIFELKHFKRLYEYYDI